MIIKWPEHQRQIRSLSKALWLTTIYHGGVFFLSVHSDVSCIGLMEIIWRFSNHTKTKWVFHCPVEFSCENMKTEGCVKAVWWAVQYYLVQKKLLYYHGTWNESKESNFRQIIKPLSFMTQSQWKLPSLCLCPAVENRHVRQQKDDNGAWTILWLRRERHSCASPGFGGIWAVCHIPEPDWVQIKSFFHDLNGRQRMSTN